MVIASLFVLASIAGHAARAEGPSPDEFFEKEVRPILVERCQECHSDAKVKGGLKLTSRSLVLTGGDGGPAAVEGKPDESPIIQAIRYQDEPKMPPKGKLPDREVETLTKWVAMGLPWPEARAEALVAAPAPGKAYQITDEQRAFWSFRPMADPKPPAVADGAWPSGAIDRFILAGLEAKGLHPAPAAGRGTLIRRVTFDLLGLPPTPDEVAAFEADPTPDAFGKVVDRLLTDPRYGQRWGRHWLDLARYADSRDVRFTGIDGDITEAWRYRDWVVSAFNRDLPYDQFVRQQLAGDLIPGPGPDGFNAEGLAATGLLTIGEWGTGDADKEKVLTDLVDDQVDVVGRTFLGLTIACARCHDHKFDPIPTADYYGLAGIFFSTRILPDVGIKGGIAPMLRTPLASPAALAEAERHKARVAELDKALASAAVEASRAQLPGTSNALLAAWDFPNRPAGQPPAEFAAARGLSPAVLARWVAYLGQGSEARLLDHLIPNVFGLPGGVTWQGGGFPQPMVMINPTDAELVPSGIHLPAHSVSVHPGPASAASVSWTSPLGGTVAVTGRLADGHPGAGDGITWTLSRRRAGLATPLAGGVIADGGSQNLPAGQGGDRLARVAVEAGDELRLIVKPAAEYSCDSTNVALTIALVDDPATRWDLAADVAPEPVGGPRTNPLADRQGHPDCWRFLEVPADDRPAPQPALDAWDAVSAEFAVGRADRAALEAAAQSAQAVLAREPDGPLARDLIASNGPFRPDPAGLPYGPGTPLGLMKAELDILKATMPTPPGLVLAAQDGGVPKTAHAGIHDVAIHVRGSYARLGPVVPRHFPSIVTGVESPPIGAGSGRLELARWLTAPEHPLTARVMANRIWQYHFGPGIVRTPSNFGKLGEAPTHPELLDFLARRFVASGWSVKALHRAILLSATYQQSSTPPAETLQADPENRLFGRMDRRRLESESLRDALLAVAGNLDPAPDGPATREFASPRRTLYYATLRSDRSSFGPLFDAADPAAIVDRRTASTVAPQSLFLMNHPFARAQSHALASRLASAGLPDDASRIRRAYLLLFARPPEPDETALGLSALAKLRSSGPDERAWAAYCQVLLCSNEFLYVD